MRRSETTYIVMIATVGFLGVFAVSLVVKEGYPLTSAFMLGVAAALREIAPRFKPLNDSE